MAILGRGQQYVVNPVVNSAGFSVPGYSQPVPTALSFGLPIPMGVFPAVGSLPLASKYPQLSFSLPPFPLPLFSGSQQGQLAAPGVQTAASLPKPAPVKPILVVTAKLPVAVPSQESGAGTQKPEVQVQLEREILELAKKNEEKAKQLETSRQQTAEKKAEDIVDRYTRILISRSYNSKDLRQLGDLFPADKYRLLLQFIRANYESYCKSETHFFTRLYYNLKWKRNEIFVDRDGNEFTILAMILRYGAEGDRTRNVVKFLLGFSDLKLDEAFTIKGDKHTCAEWFQKKEIPGRETSFTPEFMSFLLSLVKARSESVAEPAADPVPKRRSKRKQNKLEKWWPMQDVRSSKEPLSRAGKRPKLDSYSNATVVTAQVLASAPLANGSGSGYASTPPVPGLSFFSPPRLLAPSIPFLVSQNQAQAAAAQSAPSSNPVVPQMP